MKKNVYVRAQELVRELPPLIERVRRRDKKLADQLRRAAQSVVLNIALDEELDEICAITWCLSRER